MKNNYRTTSTKKYNKMYKHGNNQGRIIFKKIRETIPEKDIAYAERLTKYFLAIVGVVIFIIICFSFSM